MEFINEFGYKGLYADLPADMCPQGAVLWGSKNFRIINGKCYTRYGNELLQSAAVIGVPLLYHKHTLLDGTEYLLLFTETDVYWYDDSIAAPKWKFLTPAQGTDSDSGAGTVTTGGTGNRTVTGVGTDFQSDGADSDDYIGFNTEGDTSEPDADDITAWYLIETVSNDTSITLGEDGPAISAATGYIIRKVYHADDAAVNRWQAVSFYDSNEAQNIVAATNNTDKPIKWDGDITHTCSDLHDDAPTAKFVSVIAGRLIFGNISTINGSGTGTALPYTIIWSEASDSTAWQGGTADDAGYQELYQTEGEIQFLARVGDYVYAVKEDCLVQLQATGDSTAPIDPNYVVMGIGAKLSQYCVCKRGLIFVSENDVLIYDFRSFPQSIAAGRIRDKLFTNFNLGKWYTASSVFSPRLNEWRLSIPQSESNLPDSTWIYRIDENEWCYDDAGYTAMGAYNYKTSTTINELTGTINSYTDPINAWSVPPPFDEVILADSSGYTYIERPALKQDNGADIESIVIRRDLALGELDLYSRVLKIDHHYCGTNNTNDKVSVNISVDQGGTYTSAQMINDAKAEKKQKEQTYWTQAGRTCRIKFQGRHFELHGDKVWYQPQGWRE